MDLYSSQVQPFLELDDVGERPVLQVGYYGQRIRVPNSLFILVLVEVVVLRSLEINLPVELLLLLCLLERVGALAVLDYFQIDQLEADVLVNVFLGAALQIDRGILSGINSR